MKRAMQTIDPVPRRRDPAADWRFVLATDLDGTFLGGAEADRLELYEWIDARRDEVGLIFVSGRDPAFIEQLCHGTPVPWPDYVIGDVGTTIAIIDERRVLPIETLEADIAERWGDKGEHVRRALHGAPGLTLQPTDFRYRVSYDYDPDAYHPDAEHHVARLGLDHLISDDRYFDVLPPGVSKGPSLLRLIDHLGVDPARVLVAGDTLNDLSMFETGLKGVAVGGAEASLLERVAGLPNTITARGVGAAGIADAIAAFALHPDPPGDR